jgi:AraC family transcriptional regulator
MYDLARFDGERADNRGQSRGGLAGWQQKTVKAHIEAHLAEKVPLATLADLVGLSPSHFCRAFNKSFGTPPHRYQIELRIERAKALLAKPSASVTDIALEVGFGSSSAFANVFRKMTGVTATRYSRSF